MAQNQKTKKRAEKGKLLRMGKQEKGHHRQGLESENNKMERKGTDSQWVAQGKKAKGALEIKQDTVIGCLRALMVTVSDEAEGLR